MAVRAWLSYTEFAYSDFGVDRRMFGADDVLTFTVDVTNVGKVAGKEAVMLYSSDLVASLTPDVIRLRDFEKVALEPGRIPHGDVRCSGQRPGLRRARRLLEARGGGIQDALRQ